MGGGVGPSGAGDNGICGVVRLGCFFMAEGTGAGGTGCVTTGEAAFVLFCMGRVMTGLGGACGGGGAGIGGGGGGKAATDTGRGS